MNGDREAIYGKGKRLPFMSNSRKYHDEQPLIGALPELFSSSPFYLTLYSQLVTLTMYNHLLCIVQLVSEFISNFRIRHILTAYFVIIETIDWYFGQ